jgi:hypothetical protein
MLEHRFFNKLLDWLLDDRLSKNCRNGHLPTQLDARSFRMPSVVDAV